MAGISVPTASISASSSPAVACETNTTTVKVASCLSQLRHRRSHSKLSFSVSQKPKLYRFCSSKGTHPSFNRDVAVRAQLKKAAALDGSSNSASSPESRPEEAEYKVKNDNPSSKSSSSVLASEESISEFISQVSSLVKLVDSRDIVELKLQQLDCEVVIRKKEAVTPTQAAPMVMMQAPPPTMVPQAVPPAPTPAAAPSPSPAPAGPPAAPAKSSLPPLKCPMAGTFYRSPAPGEPAFVKVGDKVQKGQVLCIIEAMKLMNEIEADQSGTIVEVIAEDGKPVSVDTPLFVIQP